MIKAYTILKNISSPYKKLVRLSKVHFVTNPFNRPSDSKQTFMENAKNQNKTNYFVNQNVGLKSFVTRIYNTTGLSILGALGGAYVAMSIPALMMHPLATVLMGGLLTIGSFIGVQFIRPIRVEENILGNYLLKTQNPISRILLYSLGVTSLGLSASPLFAYISMISPNIIASSLAITLGIFGGASIMAYAMPKDKMLGYGRVLTGSLLGLIGLQLFGLGTAYFMGGPNTLTYLLFSLDNYAGILLFSALIAYDTHVAIKIYQMGNADHLAISIQMLLNFWNILIRVMQIISRGQNNQ